MADRSRDSFEAAQRKSVEQRVKELAPGQQREVQELKQKQKEEKDRLKAEQEQQREGAIRDAANRRMMNTMGLDTKPYWVQQKYRDMTEDAARQGERDVLTRETQDRAYLDQKHEKEQQERIAIHERQNRQRGEVLREEFRDKARDTTRKRTQDRDRDDGGRER